MRILYITLYVLAVLAFLAAIWAPFLWQCLITGVLFLLVAISIHATKANAKDRE